MLSDGTKYQNCFREALCCKHFRGIDGEQELGRSLDERREESCAAVLWVGACALDEDVDAVKFF